MTEPIDLLARLRSADPYDRDGRTAAGSEWADELADWVIATPVGDLPSRSTNHRRRVMALAAVALAIGSGVTVAAITRNDRVPMPDTARPVQQETIQGYSLSLTPAIGDDGRLCLVAQTPEGPRVSGCGERDVVLSEGAQIGTSSGDGQQTVVGFAPGKEHGTVSFGTARTSVSSQGFFVVTGRPGDRLSIR